MHPISRRHALQLAGAVGLCGCASSAAPPAATAAAYICPPCGCAMDGREFPGPGTCPACGMPLIPKPPASVVASDVPAELATGAGVFPVSGGRGRESKRIEVHYYKPRGFTARSPVLLVLPGSGRDGDEYRDAWIETSERAKVLVFSLTYAEADYDFATYQMSGIVKDLKIRNMPRGPDGQPPDSLHLRDEDISLNPNPDPDAWIFSDFDRIFGIVAQAAKSSRTTYDVFGHSAGAQIAHRSVLLNPRSKADRIVAGNSGMYSLPDTETALPIGLKDLGVTPETLRAAFGKRLTLLLGELDNDGEKGGNHLHTPLFDQQGVDRLSRGKYFFKAGQDAAAKLNAPLNWKLQIVPGVGHDFRAMSRAAGALLYP